MKIAIIGTGISGLSTAYYLNEAGHDITIYEKDSRTGGHANTAHINYDGENIDVDTGFIVFNRRTYPNLIKLFAELKVESDTSNMSFSVMNDSLEYSSEKIFAQIKNIFSLKHWAMIKDILRFNKSTQNAEGVNLTLGEYLEELKVSNYFIKNFIQPMAAAIWSSTPAEILNFPAYTLIEFFNNHGLNTLKNRPQWYTVHSGSRQYVSKLTAGFIDKIKLNSEVKEVYRSKGKVIVDGIKFDKVILATHGDVSSLLLKDKDFGETEILGGFEYKDNYAILHKDASIMPKAKKAWASWNYHVASDNICTLTYWMNLLQPHIAQDKPLFVTLNAEDKINPNMIFNKYHYRHPQYTQKSVTSQKRIDEIQGKGGIYYAGAYLRYGFHEDGIWSAKRVVELINNGK